ncbi:hypothetical protein N0V83_005820 [Neocucurbitaria cava]|uniref:Xylanolytic transcriptional activator regulatory domain-containing protein n=1 Tax=Neocucurbitaria cava TaxID=798079 RepID=A0A9W8Y8C4_9PLEO|nr:hypothetical protein N0V83_005820 [Neocucurbitaria cava]
MPLGRAGTDDAEAEAFGHDASRDASHDSSDDGSETEIPSASSEAMGQPPVMLSSESQKHFEADHTDIASSYSHDELSIQDKRAFIQCFLAASSGLLDLYTWEDISQMLQNHDPASPSPEGPAAQKLNSMEEASLYLMAAIGAQCRGRTTDDLAWAAKLFSYARKLALENMLEIPSLELIRAFLLMAFYMFGACRRNAAFMYLGVASKAADILGLHMSAQYKHLSSDARNARLRTAKSLRVFDVVCNSILGRPSSTPALRPGHTSYVNDDMSIGSESTYKALALGASYEIAAVLNAAVSKSAEGGLDAEAAEGFVLALRQCSRTFPSVLRQPDNSGDSNGRHVTLGNVHVAGTYYFSVILVTQHFLIQHVVPQLSGQAQIPSARHSDSTLRTTENVKITHLADACIEAAIFMAQMCHQVMRSGSLLGNMCIVKAWLFATGLVLGFSLLVEDGSNNSKRRAAFLKSLHVLGELKRLSPQAEQYYSIISSFHQAIKTYKEQLHREKEGSLRNLVDRVFMPDQAAEFEESENLPTQLPSPDMTVMDAHSAEWSNETALGSLNGMLPVDPALIGENDVIMRMLWDPYAMNYTDSIVSDAEINLDPQIQIRGSLAQ